MRRRRLAESLSGDFAAIVLLVALLGSTIFSAVGIYSAYRDIESEIESELRRIENRFVVSISQSVWKLDLLQTALQLELIAGSEIIHDVEIRSDVAGLSYHSALPHEISLPVNYRAYDLQYDDSGALGSLTVGVMHPWELLRMRENLTIEALFEFAKIGLLMLAVYLASAYFLTRPLQRLQRAVDAIDPSDPDDSVREETLQEIRQKRNNEIGAVADAFGRLLDRARREIGEREESQRELASSLEGKDLLLQEVHHRVKNNLQLIVSMLALQRRAHAGEALDSVLSSAQNRVYSMSLVHQLLHRDRGVEHLNLREYLDTLLQELVGMSETRVAADVSGDDVHILPDQAIPLGLIVTEIVLNALKYAFPEQKDPLLTLSVSITSDRCTVRIRDNGAGFSAEEWGEENLGVRLVDALSEQIGAKIEREEGEGTRYRITFALLQREPA